MLQTSLKTCTITNNKKSNRQISLRETNHIQMASQFHFSCCTDPIDNWSGTALKLKQRNVQFTIQTKSSKSGLGPIENQQPHANRWFSSHLPPVVSHLDGNVNNGIILHLESRLNCSFFSFFTQRNKWRARFPQSTVGLWIASLLTPLLGFRLIQWKMLLGKWLAL